MKTFGTTWRRGRCGGLTLIEAMILLVVLSIVAVGAGVGLQSVAKVPRQTDDVLAVNSAVMSLMEQTRSTAWASMASSSGTMTINNKVYAWNVNVVNSDPDGNGVQTDYRTITATVGSESMSVYVTQP